MNLAGGVDEITYPSGNKVRSCQDNGARTREVTRTKGAATSSIATALQYEGDGELQAVTLGNGVKELLCRNSRRQTTGWVVRAGSASGCEASLQDLLNTTSDYGNSTMNNGNVRGQGWSLYLPGSVIRSYQQTHTYDSLNRLRTTSEANTTANGPWTLTNGYDRYGNRYVETAMTSGLTMTPGTPVGAGWFSSATNRLTQGSGGVAASFDGAGNLIGHPDLGSMTYDEENRMLTWAEGGITVSQVYDGAGRRVQRVKGTRTTTYVYEAGGQLMAEYDTAPEAVTEAMQYRHGDMLDSTRLLTGGSGQVIWRQDYFPFGEEIAGASSLGRRNEIPGYGVGSAVKQRFTGKAREAESELDYFGARFLSASLGRFTGADAPFADQTPGSPQSWNLFSYVGNNPLGRVDPNGLAWIPSGSSADPFTWVSSCEGRTPCHNAVAAVVNGNVFTYGLTQNDFTVSGANANGRVDLSFLADGSNGFVFQNRNITATFASAAHAADFLNIAFAFRDSGGPRLELNDFGNADGTAFGDHTEHHPPRSAFDLRYPTETGSTIDVNRASVGRTQTLLDIASRNGYSDPMTGVRTEMRNVNGRATRVRSALQFGGRHDATPDGIHRNHIHMARPRR